jgi:hypothetical protein
MTIFVIMPNPGVLALIHDAVGIGSDSPFIGIFIFKNILIYPALVFFSLFNSLLTYKPMILGFLILIFMKLNLRQGFIELEMNSKKELSYILVLILPILCVRNYYYYVMPFQVLAFIILAEIFKNTLNAKSLLLVGGVAISSLLMKPANPNASVFKEYPFYTSKGRDNAEFYNYLEALPRHLNNSKYIVISNQAFSSISNRQDIQYYNPWFLEPGFCEKNKVVPDIIFLPHWIMKKNYNKKNVEVFFKCIYYSQMKYKIARKLERNTIMVRE